jgi:membrane-associated protein
MVHWLTDQVSASAITYLVVFAAAAGDVLIPLIPSETIVITAAVVATKGGLAIWLIIPCAALGGFVGDNASYLLGRTIGDPVARRLFRGEKGTARLEWAERAIDTHASLLVLVGRFVPGGRTVSTFAAGTLEMPYRRFAATDALAATLWAIYAAMLGYAGGETFKHSSWKPLAMSLGLAALIALAVELWRRFQKQRGRDILGDPIES